MSLIMQSKWDLLQNEGFFCGMDGLDAGIAGEKGELTKQGFSFDFQFNFLSVRNNSFKKYIDESTCLKI